MKKAIKIGMLLFVAIAMSAQAPTPTVGAQEKPNQPSQSTTNTNRRQTRRPNTATTANKENTQSEASANTEQTNQETNRRTNRTRRQTRRANQRQTTPPQTDTTITPPATDTPAATTASQEDTQTTGGTRTRSRRQRSRSATMTGIPTGAQNCIDQLTELASNDPLISYEGRPEEIVNNGLLWNDPQSKCSVGSDSSLRMKVFEMTNAWRIKDTARVRSLLQEIKSAAPQS